MKKILLSLGATGITLAMIPLFAAFEAHVVNVTARIENALEVPLAHIDFGTVFPQETLVKDLPVRLSGSFMLENRVDDVEYIIRQKPKCGVTTNNGTILVGQTATGHVIPNGNGGYTVDCGPDPRLEDEAGNPLPVGSSWGQLPLLCPYISKHENTVDQDPKFEGGDNDGGLNSFHVPFTVGTSTVTWTDTPGRLVKSAGDISDNWLIDLAVPCFGGFCAQDWADFVHRVSGSMDTDPSLYTQPIENEHKVFGCDLWLEVTGVSEATQQIPG